MLLDILGPQIQKRHQLERLINFQSQQRSQIESYQNSRTERESWRVEAGTYRLGAKGVDRVKGKTLENLKGKEKEGVGFDQEWNHWV